MLPIIVSEDDYNLFRTFYFRLCNRLGILCLKLYFCLLFFLTFRRQDRSPGPYATVCSCHFKDGMKANGPTIFDRNKEKLFNIEFMHSIRAKYLSFVLFVRPTKLINYSIHSIQTTAGPEA